MHTKEIVGVGSWKGKKEVARSAHDQKRGDAPLLVAIDEPWCDSADVRTSTNEQEDNEQK